MRYLLAILLLSACAPHIQTRGHIVYSGPVQRRFIDGYSRSYPKPWPFTRENSYIGREPHFSAESIPDYLDHNLKGLP